MKKIMLITFVLVLLGTGSLWAKQGHSPERKLQHLTKALQLDTTQQKQISVLMEAQHAKIKQLREEGRASIEAILNDHQKVKFTQMREKRKQKRDKRGNNGG